ncbi:Crp/Fnr family transcriptional regulator [Sphingomonas sp. TZW2008]|uniref:Crp/Fnr family transcriptional regulator n=1 Tax=Sphingomonas sp. TZW2008 TaxID=1917973 RepID=UPI000A26A70B|nr:Crp/Fnr family transcriptional regulator [Sphingomonas sp. TZW2008]
MTIADDLMPLLARSGWFVRQPAALQRRLAAAGRVVSLAAGQWVYSQGDEGTGLCALLSGALRLEVALDAERDVLIGLATPPAILGQTRRRGGGPRIVTTRANVPSRVLLIADDALEMVAVAEPGVWRAVNELVYAQLEEMTRVAARLLIQGPAARVAWRLLQIADGPEAKIGQADLAELTGLSRKTVNAHLAAFEAAGAITRGYRGVRIVDASALSRMIR